LFSILVSASFEVNIFIGFGFDSQHWAFATPHLGRGGAAVLFNSTFRVGTLRGSMCAFDRKLCLVILWCVFRALQLVSPFLKELLAQHSGHQFLNENFYSITVDNLTTSFVPTASVPGIANGVTFLKIYSQSGLGRGLVGAWSGPGRGLVGV
jgi:hypothetical protein